MKKLVFGILALTSTLAFADPKLLYEDCQIVTGGSPGVYVYLTGAKTLNNGDLYREIIRKSYVELYEDRLVKLINKQNAKAVLMFDTREILEAIGFPDQSVKNIGFSVTATSGYNNLI